MMMMQMFDKRDSYVWKFEKFSQVLKDTILQ